MTVKQLTLGVMYALLAFGANWVAATALNDTVNQSLRQARRPRTTPEGEHIGGRANG